MKGGALFPLSDCDSDRDVARYRVSLLSMRLFPPSESDIDAKFGMGTVPILAMPMYRYRSVETSFGTVIMNSQAAFKNRFSLSMT